MAKAWEHEYFVVTAPWHNPARVIDITGDVLGESGTFRHWVCVQINLERKRFLWDNDHKIERVQKKYGARVHTEWYHEEDWWVLESRDPDLTVAQIQREFGIMSPGGVRREAEDMKKGLGS